MPGPLKAPNYLETELLTLPPLRESMPCANHSRAEGRVSLALFYKCTNVIHEHGAHVTLSTPQRPCLFWS